MSAEFKWAMFWLALAGWQGWRVGCAVEKRRYAWAGLYAVVLAMDLIFFAINVSRVR